MIRESNIARLLFSYWNYIALSCLLPVYGNYWSNFQSTELDLKELPFDVPDEYELERGFLLPAPNWWGDSLRKDRSVRILLLGGSNTEHASGKGFGDYLADEMETRIRSGDWNKNSYIINEGIAGAGPEASLHKWFSFQEKEAALWPNIVILEYSVNERAGWEAARLLDRLIHVLSGLWATKGLKRPSYLLLDLFSVGAFYSLKGGFDMTARCYPRETDGAPYWSSAVTGNVADEVAKLNPPLKSKHPIEDSFGFSRGAEVGNYYAAVARFYGIPMISLADALYPSFSRFFVKTTKGRKVHINQKWPFNGDGIHLSTLGEVLLVRKFLVPFLQEQLSLPMSPFSGMRDSIYDYDIRMFPAINYVTAETIAYFNSWGTAGKKKNTLKQVVVTSPTVSSSSSAPSTSMSGWRFLSIRNHEADGAHVCYGSNDPVSPIADASSVVGEDGVAGGGKQSGLGAAVEPQPGPEPALFKLQFHASYCSPSAPCSLQLSYVHSWNTSYVGDMLCNLYRLADSTGRDLASFDASSSLMPNGGFRIRGDRVRGELIHDTTVHSHRIARNITEPGFHLLRCDKMPYASDSGSRSGRVSSSSIAKPDGLLSCIAGVSILSAAAQ